MISRKIRKFKHSSLFASMWVESIWTKTVPMYLARRVNKISLVQYYVSSKKSEHEREREIFQSIFEFNLYINLISLYLERRVYMRERSSNLFSSNNISNPYLPTDNKKVIQTKICFKQIFWRLKIILSIISYQIYIIKLSAQIYNI